MDTHTSEVKLRPVFLDKRSVIVVSMFWRDYERSVKQVDSHLDVR